MSLQSKKDVSNLRQEMENFKQGMAIFKTAMTEVGSQK